MAKRSSSSLCTVARKDGEREQKMKVEKSDQKLSFIPPIIFLSPSWTPQLGWSKNYFHHFYRRLDKVDTLRCWGNKDLPLTSDRAGSLPRAAEILRVHVRFRGAASFALAMFCLIFHYYLTLYWQYYISNCSLHSVVLNGQKNGVKSHKHKKF